MIRLSKNIALNLVGVGFLNQIGIFDFLGALSDDRGRQNRSSRAPRSKKLLFL
jgi:hypothetical protein